MIRSLPILLSLLAGAHAHFEGRHLHPLDITPDGAYVLAVNAPGGFLSVFTPGTAEHPAPVLIAEIPVGLEPVTVRARTDTEAWVINEVSDTVSVIDLTRRAVVCTLPIPDEPADVVFHDDRAFVSCGRANRIAVIDTTTLAETASIPVEGNFVRALTLSPDGTRLRAAFLYPGNRSTILNFRLAPPQSPPSDPDLPTPPSTGLIVHDSDPRIPYTVQDHDVAEIDTATLEVTGYLSGLGTNILALTHTHDGTLWAGASEARNLIRFEPELRGIFAESRIVRVPQSGEPLTIDLNPHAVAPVTQISEKNLALSQPMAIAASGSHVWLAAFASDRIAEMDDTGEIVRRIDLRSPTTPDLVRGPRGITRHPSLPRLYVLNKLSGTLSVIDEIHGAVIAEVPIAAVDPLPPGEKSGRGYFFDARRSGNGTVSCGSCHFDADHDGVAWDLGDPAGEMLTLIERHIAFGQTDPIPVPAHPMRGPMVTQSLRGIGEAAPFHWRGDKQRIQDFNPTFEKLQAGQELPADDMDLVAAYLESLSNHPNPNRLPDDSFRTTLNGGDPVKGRELFHRNEVCSKCHAGPRGTNHHLDDHAIVLSQQPVKNSTLEHFYRKLGYTPAQAVSARGFGFNHDGSGHFLPLGHAYAQAKFDRIPGGVADVTAFLLSMDTGTKPAVGTTTLLLPGQPASALVSTLEAQAAAGNCDLVLRGVIHGKAVAFLYQAQSGRWLTARSGISLTLAEIHGLMIPGDTLEILGVLPGKGTAYSIDRDRDGLPDDDAPMPRLLYQLRPEPRVLSDSAAPGWVTETSADLRHWKPATASPVSLGDGWFQITPHPAGPFYRLRRTW